jgi:hypothetical protein
MGVDHLCAADAPMLRRLAIQQWDIARLPGSSESAKKAMVVGDRLRELAEIAEMARR